ncbi:exported hypothetical protein [Nitrospira lenta]|uniref:Uncharacterized protein n=1 Tax=Nitrospira lenta TaxID=1436998 RepID=A0A330L2G3_9BACT|nr:exported hypothetical protein [Nitrospira lenta]
MEKAIRKGLVQFLGWMFFLLGTVILSLFIWALFVQQQSIAADFIILGCLMPTIGIILGLLLLYRFAHETFVTANGVTFSFPLGAHVARWEEIVWYRYVARRWRVVDERVTLLTLFKIVGPSKRSRLVLAELVSLQTRRGWRTRNYTSELNSFCPLKDRTRR